MASEAAPSGREFEQLAARVDAIDEQGTRGTVAAVTMVTAQLAEAIKDIGALQGQVAAHERTHDAERERADRDRVSSRRWAVATVLTVLGLLAAILAAVLPLAIRGHP